MRSLYRTNNQRSGNRATTSLRVLYSQRALGKILDPGNESTKGRDDYQNSKIHKLQDMRLRAYVCNGAKETSAVPQLEMEPFMVGLRHTRKD